MSSNVFMNNQLERIADYIDAGKAGGGSLTVNLSGVGDMTGATAGQAGVHGLVPAPAAGDEQKVLSGAGTWIDAGSDVAELGDLEDVTITSPTSGESLKYDGSKWINGNVTAELPDFIEETSGNIVTVEAAERPAKSLVVAIEPQQDLHGYDSPWVGGAGKNKCDTHGYAGIGYNGAVGTAVTFRDSTTTVTVNKNTISYSVPSWGGVVFKTARLPSGIYSFHAEFSSTVNRKTFYVLNNNNVIKDAGNYSDSGGILNILRVLEEGDCIAIWIGCNNAVDITITNMQVESGNSYTTFAPYSNICPISGWTGCEVTVADDVDNPTVEQTYTIPFPSEAGTVYGGMLDVVNGVLTVTKANIASYDGETLPGAWISDMDVYAEGTTPTTGAQVVYDLDTPITYRLTPTEVQMLLGTNNIWADTGEVKELKYIPQTYNDLLEEVTGGVNYSTSEQNTGLKWIDGKSIYQRTVTFTVTGGNVYVSNPTGITGVDNIIDHQGIGRVGDFIITETAYNNPPTNNNSIAILYNLQSNEIYADYRATSEANGATFYITFLYTKI